MIIATAILAGSAAIIYALKRHFAKADSPTPQPSRRTHHRTTVFAKAKEMAVEGSVN